MARMTVRPGISCLFINVSGYDSTHVPHANIVY